jgi:hypothetical protein
MARTHEDVNRSEPEGGAEQEDMRDDRVYQNRGSMAIIGCNPERAKGLARTDTVKMATIYGQLRGLTEVKKLVDQQTQAVRDSWGLAGHIEAINEETGQIFHFPVFYFPSGFHEAFVAEMRAQLAAAPDAAMIEFAWEIHARPDPNPRGYSWTAFNLLGRTVNDPLASLRHRTLAASRERIALPGPRSDSSAAA